MKQILNSPYSRLFIAGLVLIVICAWCSMGSFYPDEHYQVLEFCAYKLGNASPNSYSLPWEYYSKIRASFLPDIAYLLGKTLQAIGLYNPFTLAFLLRLLAGVSGWYIVCRFCLLLLPKLKSSAGKKLLILMSLFLWFIPFMAVRYTAENISGIIMLYGLYSILNIEGKTTRIFVRYIIAGFLFGMASFIRPQISFALAGFGVWLIWMNKTHWKYIAGLVFFALIAIGINILMDYWFYGEWTFTPFNYYYEDIVHHIVEDPNMNPWWFYFSEFVSNVIPPLSLVLLVMFIAGVYKNLKDPFAWMIIPFVIIHCFIGHKELRFLFPVTFLFIYITALGFDYFLYQPAQPKGKKIIPKNDGIKVFYQKIHQYIYLLCIIICVPLLLYRTIAPVKACMYGNRFLYNNVPAKNTPVFYIPNMNGDLDNDLNTSFYKNPEYKTVLVDNLDQAGDYLRNNKPQSAFLFSTLSFGSASKGGDDDKLVWNGYNIKRVYCFYPSWLLKNDMNNWKEKTSIYWIYEFTPVDSSSVFDVYKLLQNPATYHDLNAVNAILSYTSYLLQNNKPDEAGKILDTLEERTPGAAIPHLHDYLGMVYFQKNREKDAESEFNTEIALNLQKEEAYLSLGMLYFHSKDYEDAVKSMKSVLTINPNNVDALNNIGVYFLFVKKDYAQAIQYFASAVNSNLFFRQGYVNFMICAQNFNDNQVSIKYQRILLDDRSDPYTWVVVQPGMPKSDIQALGIPISDVTLKKINSAL